nr:MAG: replication initiator protein [Microvirus sp.]
MGTTDTMQQRCHYRSAKAAATVALSIGGRSTSATSVEVDYSGRCERPVPVTIWGRNTHSRRDPKSYETPSGQRIDVDMHVRCRQCPACLRARSAQWTYRAQAEIRGSQRSWFVTLTLRPDLQHRAACQAEVIARKRGIKWDEITARQSFVLRTKVIGEEITKYIKRVRKESGARLRYIVVAEAHKSGLPHFHMLVHECEGSPPVLHRHLSAQWRMGFTRVKLVEEGTKAARYVTKYLAKEALSRVRASLSYGNPTISIAGRIRRYGDTACLQHAPLNASTFKGLIYEQSKWIPHFIQSGLDGPQPAGLSEAARAERSRRDIGPAVPVGRNSGPEPARSGHRGDLPGDRSGSREVPRGRIPPSRPEEARSGSEAVWPESSQSVPFGTRARNGEGH